MAVKPSFMPRQGELKFLRYHYDPDADGPNDDGPLNDAPPK
jgi:hypothetical protein